MLLSGCWWGVGGGGGGRGGGLGAGFGAFDAVFGTADATLFDASGIKSATDNVITDTGEVFNTAATHQNNGMFLQIVAFVRDVSDDFIAVSQAHFGHFTHG